MPDIENLLREELKRAAEEAQPELLRPLQVPTRRPSWRLRLLPLAAAAAVVAVITAAALVAGLTTAHKPAAATAAVSGSAPTSLPRFYVATSSTPNGRGIEAVVRASGSGQVTGTVPVSSAIPVEWADSGGTFVTAATDDRSFIIGVQGGQAPTKDGLDLHLFRFAISAAGHRAVSRREAARGLDDAQYPGELRPHHPGPQPGHRGHPDLDRTYPQLPVPDRAALLGRRQPGDRVHLAELRTVGPHGRAAGNPLLDITAPGDNLLAGKVIVPSGVVAAGSVVSALITPDGRDVIVVTWRDLTPRASIHTVVVQFAELSSQGQYALVQGIQFGWLDVGGSNPGRFTSLPAVPAGQYVNFAAW